MPSKLMIDGMQQGPRPLYYHVKETTDTPELFMGRSARA